MKDIQMIFSHLPNIAIIMDAYGYVLDYNQKGIFGKLRKGMQLRYIMPDIMNVTKDEYRYEDRVFRRKVTPVMRENAVVGYTVLLADITEEVNVRENRRKLKSELEELVRENSEANKKLETLAIEAKELSDYSEQLSIARQIHDGFGHTITEVHTITEMCLKLRGQDDIEYKRLLSEGIQLCEEAEKSVLYTECTSIDELVERIKRLCAFPIEISVEGTEPDRAKELYEIFERICKEAYHNTLSHSLADKLFIKFIFSEDSITLSIVDNGSFHGTFEMGFGLSVMTEYVAASGGSVDFVTNEGEGFGITANWRKQK